MGNSFCEGEHTPGVPFESGNVYCKRCGEFLCNTEPLPKTPPMTADEAMESKSIWDKHGRMIQSRPYGGTGRFIADDDCEDEI